MRVLLFSGKGGVGKTSLAAATALHAAQRGQRVALLSADPAHSLADALEHPLGAAPCEVVPGVEAREVGVLAELDRSWEAIHRWLAQLLLDARDLVAEELLVLPGLEELMALCSLADLEREGRHDLAVMDCAPTAATLRLLRLPAVLQGLLGRLDPARGRLGRVLGAPPEAIEAARQLAERVAAAGRLLLDPACTSVRLVTLPRAMVVAETRRAWSYFCLHGVHTDALLVNRVLPASAGGERLAGWRAREAESLAALEEDFPLPRLRATLEAQEPRGVAALAALGAALYEACDPTAVLSRASALRFETGAAGTRLRLRLPHASPERLELARRGDELDIGFGLARRRVALPEAVARYDLVGAHLAGGELTVEFQAPAAGA